MGKNGIFIILVAVVVIGFIWFFFIRNKKQSTPDAGTSGRDVNPLSTQSSNNQPASQVSSRYVKNEQGTISLIQYRTDTNETIASRILTFDEAVKALGSFNAVCLPVPQGKGATGYKNSDGVNPCSIIRVNR